MHMPALLFALAAAASAAEARDFCADRPGLATGTCLVPHGEVQLETSLVGWSRTDEPGARSTEWTLGSSVLRLGLGSAGEVQLGWTPWMRSTEREGGARTRSTGVGDATVAFKQLLTEVGPVAIAVMPVVKLPLARRPIGNRRVEGGFLLPVDYDLSDRWSLTVTPELGWNADSDGRGRHLGLGLAGGPEFQLAERIAVSVNARFLRDWDPAGSVTEAVVGLAFAWFALPNLQLDFEADAGLSRAAPDLQLLLGFSIRP